MTELDRRIELEALITEREGMVAENAQHQDSQPYGELSFFQLADKMRSLRAKPQGAAIRRDCYGYNWGGNNQRGYSCYPREAGARCNIRGFFFDSGAECKDCDQYRPGEEKPHD